MEHPSVIRPADHAPWRADKMGKGTLYQSRHLLLGVNAFEAGQLHALHTHADADKAYQVIDGAGFILLQGREIAVAAGDMLVAPAGVPHGVRNPGPGRLLVLVIMAPPIQPVGGSR
jgi:mannose-6-phosphate isomerase-like protein (cupin superfamily)